jgi:hypothetical protein
MKERVRKYYIANDSSNDCGIFEELRWGLPLIQINALSVADA